MPNNMEPIREISEEISSDVNYSNFRAADEGFDSINQLRHEIRAEVMERELNGRCCSMKCSWVKSIEVIALLVLVCLVWLAMSVPSALYIFHSVVSYII